jgi:hypothetical protein
VFRRFQNPLLQGTDISPNVMQGPPVVRVENVPQGSAEEAVVADAFAPAINNFILGQRQQQSISGRQVYRVSRRFPEFSATYVRLHGQEIIHVRVSPVALSRILREAEQRATDMLMDLMVLVNAYVENLE